MPDQVQAQAAPAAPETASGTNEVTLHPAETIASFRQLLDGLEEILAPNADPTAAARKAAALCQAAPAPEPSPPSEVAQIGTAPAPAIPAPVSTIAPANTRLRSSRLWTTVGGILALGGGQIAGLPPITQVCITALAGVYIIMRTYKGGQ